MLSLEQKAEMIYVTDTHSFLWFLVGSDKLSFKFRKIFERAESGDDTIIVPTIVLAEIM